jgi:hypothetical protein
VTYFSYEGVVVDVEGPKRVCTKQQQDALRGSGVPELVSGTPEPLSGYVPLFGPGKLSFFVANHHHPFVTSQT